MFDGYAYLRQPQTTVCLPQASRIMAQSRLLAISACTMVCGACVLSIADVASAFSPGDIVTFAGGYQSNTESFDNYTPDSLVVRFHPTHHCVACLPL